MMEVYANNIRLPISETISLRLLNPSYNDVIGYSFPIRIDARLPEVKKAFGFAGELPVDWAEEIEGRIRTDQVDLIGTWKITEASEDFIETYFNTNSRNFYAELGNKLLSSLSYGGVKYPEGLLATMEDMIDHYESKFEATYPTDDYVCFCAYTPNAYGENTTEDTFKIVNEIEYTDEGVLQLKDKLDGNQTNNSLYLFVGTVLDYLFAETGYQISKNVFREDANLMKLVIFNTYNTRLTSAVDYTKLVPGIPCRDFLKAITNRFNIGFFIDEGSKKVDIMYFDDLVSEGPVSLGTKFRMKPFADNRRTIGLTFPLNAPDEWSDHNINGVDDFLPFVPIEVDKLRDISPGPLTLYNVYFVKAESAYYRVTYAESVYSATRVCMRNFPHTEGDSSGTEVVQYSGIPGMYTSVLTQTWTEQVWDPELETYVPTERTLEVDVVMPRCDLKVTDILNPNEGYPLMFLFSRGLQEGYIAQGEGMPESLTYPFANNDIYDAAGAAITDADMALNWKEDNGLIDAFWLNWINWELNLKKTVRGPLTPEDIRILADFSRIVRIENNNFIVSKLDIELSGDRSEISEAILYRL